MATYTDVTAKSATNDGITVDTITFTPDINQVTVINRSVSATLWVRMDGTAPSIAGDDCYPVPPGAVLTRDMQSHSPDVVKVLADASCPYTVAAS